jgi:hypothetical protein
LSLRAFVVVCVSLVASLANGRAAVGDSVRGVDVAANDIVLVRGGTLFVPLRAEREGTNWPSTIRILLEDGRRIVGAVAWIHAPTDAPIGWSRDPRSLRVRPVRAQDDSSQPGGGRPYLLARMPSDTNGAVQVTGTMLRTRWANRYEPPVDPGTPPLVLERRDDRPDPLTPFAYWRWALIADAQRVPPPDSAAYGELGQLVAEHFADLWRIALARVGAVSPSVGRTCRDLLIAVCNDGRRPFAAWVSDDAMTGRLLTLLLDPRKQGEALRDEALAWADEQQPVLSWLEAADGAVHLAMANRSSRPVLAKFAWIGRDDIPIAVDLDPWTLTTVVVDRPMETVEEDLDDLDGAIERRTDESEPPTVDALRITLGDLTFALPVGPEGRPALPPAAFRFAFRSPLTLADLGGPIPVSPWWQTTAELRMLERRWEVFFECRRPQGETTSLPALTGEGAASWLPTGTEAVAIMLGGEPEDDPGAVRLVVPEHGEPRVLAGGGLPADLEVHRRSYDDRWFCRIVLPRAWLGGSGRSLRLGAARTEGGRRSFQAAPHATAGWRPVIGRVRYDLTTWDGDLVLERDDP